MLVVPNADSGAEPMPRTGAVTLTVAPETPKFNEPVTAVVPTWAVAEIEVAPESLSVEGCTITVATPAASVKAVKAGVIVTRLASVLNVTIAFGTTAPLPSLIVAVTVPGAAIEIEVIFCPAVLVRAKVSVGATGGVAVA